MNNKRCHCVTPITQQITRILEALWQKPGIKTKYIFLVSQHYNSLWFAYLTASLLSGNTVCILGIRVLHWPNRVFELGVFRSCLYPSVFYYVPYLEPLPFPIVA